jgi:alpha-tubulin suppressor-like RCC1 family protein
LGHGDETGENVPKEIIFFRENGIKILVIEAGEGNSAVITMKNELMVWGIGLHGRLGTGKTNNVHRPTYLDDMQSIKVDDVSLGSNHTLCILRNGKVMCWGSSKDGKMGLEAALDRNFLVPRELIALEREKIYQVATGPFHSLVLTENGQILSFGNAKDGKLGFEDVKSNVIIPKKIINTSVVFQKKWNADNDRN